MVGTRGVAAVAMVVALVGCGASQHPLAGMSASEVRAIPKRTRVVWVFDQSASTEFTDPTHVRYAALDDALYTLLIDPHAAVAAVSFSDTIRAAGFTRDAEELFAAVDPTHVGGGSNLEDALREARRLIEADAATASPQLRVRTRYIVSVVTDGAPTGALRRLMAKEGPDDPADLEQILEDRVRSIRDLEGELTLGHVSVHFRLGGEPLPPSQPFDLDLRASRALYTSLADLGDGTFREVRPEAAVCWPLVPEATPEERAQAAQWAGRQ